MIITIFNRTYATWRERAPHLEKFLTGIRFSVRKSCSNPVGTYATCENEHLPTVKAALLVVRLRVHNEVHNKSRSGFPIVTGSEDFVNPTGIHDTMLVNIYFALSIDEKLLLV